MNRLATYACAPVALAATLLVGSSAWGVAENPGPPGAIPPVPASVDDSRPEGPDELENLPGAALSNTQANTQLMVEDNPALTDRGFIHVPAAHFTPGNTSLIGGFDDSFRFEDGFVFDTSGNFGIAVAPVYLPEGVTVTLVRLSAIDDSASGLSLHLHRGFAFTDDWDEMSYIQTSGDTPDLRLWRDETILYPQVENGLYAYWLWANGLGPNQRLRSVFIYYEH